MSASTDRFETLRDACRVCPPRAFVVLGSGMGDLATRVAAIASVSFPEIPGLPASSVAGHRGRLSLGRWAGRCLLLSEGRLHAYEGHSPEVVERPIRLAADLGVRFAVLTNAAGGIRDDLVPGSLMPVRDHLQWNRPAPWRAPAEPSPYDPDLLAVLQRAGRRLGLALHPGVYAAVRGPSYETPAEIRALRIAGADAVGMSTSQEVRAGRSVGLRCAAVSLITNRAAGLGSGNLSHREVLAISQSTAERLGDLIEQVLRLAED